MSNWIGQHFLLENLTGRRLFNDYAKDLPIIDFHNHLNVHDIATDRRFSNLTELWLESDHYKWRAMRVLGIDEKYITGDASPRQKFKKWAYTIDRLPGNALYHWAHMELQRYFNIYEPLTESNADDIYESTKMILKGEDKGAVGLLNHMNVEILCTTDDPSSDLTTHNKINQQGIGFKVFPTFRPDKLICPDTVDYSKELQSFGSRYGIQIHDFEDLFTAFDRSIIYFKESGCKTSDHSFSIFDYTNDDCSDEILTRVLDGQQISMKERIALQSKIMRHLVRRYDENEFVMQLHLGARRNNNRSLYDKLGPDAGGDSIGNPTNIEALSSFLSYADANNSLPNTVLYCLNPTDNAPLATLAASFSSAGVFGKVQFGSAWWFLDNPRGISAQLDELIETGLISTFIGMLTDSRSITSFCRHEYFRRILCNKLGALIERGEYAASEGLLGKMVQNISYWNAKEFFKF